MAGQVDFQKEMNDALNSMLIKDEGEIRFQSFEGVEFYNLAFKTSFFGTLWATNFRLLFVSAESPQIKDPEWHSSIPYTSMEKFDRKKSRNSLVIEGKDVQTIKYKFQSNDQRKAVMNCLSLFPPQKLVTKDKLFAWAQAPKKKLFLPYTVKKDWDRFAAKYSAFEKEWRISNVNENYEVCDTYPPNFIVPKYTSDDQLREVAGARSKGRLPILSYVHGSGAAIVRCAQPLSGMVQKKSTADVQMIKDFLKTNPSQNPSLVIADARPKLNAAANRAAGAGYEKTSHYPNTTLDFLDIENIHVMRNALKALKECCFDTVNEDKNAWFAAVESTQWLLHISLILSGAMHVVRAILNDTNVLVHCSDGWDRTSQLTSISMIILDPFYRTITGFLSLIEKEWLQAGHKFDDRVHDTGSSENSPVFLQFLDCVWQIMQQRPTFFEFGEALLLDMAEALFSCRFGNFLYNCEKDREKNKLKENTTCLWTTIHQRRQGYMNKTYIVDSNFDSVLGIHTQLKHIRIWRGYYFRNNVNLSDFSLDKVASKPTTSSENEINQKDEYISCLMSLLKQHNIPFPAPPSFPPPPFSSSSSSFPPPPYGNYPLDIIISIKKNKHRNSSMPSSLTFSLATSPPPPRVPSRPPLTNSPSSPSTSFSRHSPPPRSLSPPPPPPPSLPSSSPSPSPLPPISSSPTRRVYSPIRGRPTPSKQEQGTPQIKKSPKRSPRPSPIMMSSPPPGVLEEDPSFTIPPRPSRSSRSSSPRSPRGPPPPIPRDTTLSPPPGVLTSSVSAPNRPSSLTNSNSFGASPPSSSSSGSSSGSLTSFPPGPIPLRNNRAVSDQFEASQDRPQFSPRGGQMY